MIKRCPYCKGEYEIEVGEIYEEHRTADNPPPAEFAVYAKGRTMIHYCQKGTEVLL